MMEEDKYFLYVSSVTQTNKKVNHVLIMYPNFFVVTKFFCGHQILTPALLWAAVINLQILFVINLGSSSTMEAL